jgi:hypothetical protein
MKKVPTDNPDVFENFLVRDLKYDGDKIFRRVVGEKVDAKGKRLSYEQLIDVTFNRDTSFIQTRQMGAENDKAKAVVEKIHSEFARQRNCLNSWAIREWIRHFILSLQATQVRPGGGVYFVTDDYADEIDRLGEFCEWLGEGVVFHSLPLVDDASQRKMIREAYEVETVGAAKTLLDEIAEINTKGDRISERKYEEMLGQYQALAGKTEEYSTLLDDQLQNASSHLELLMKSMMQPTVTNVRWKEQ